MTVTHPTSIPAAMSEAATLAPTRTAKRPTAAGGERSADRETRGMSLSLRLAAIYGLLIAATVLLVAGVTVAIARSQLEHTLDAQLRSTAHSFQYGPAARARGADELRAETRRWLAEHPLPQDQMAAIRILGGRVLTSVGGLDLFEVGDPRSLLAAKRAAWLKLDGSDGTVRGLTVPIRANGRQLGTLVLLAYERPLRRTLDALLLGIAVASALGIAVALSLGVLVVRRSLNPLKRMVGQVAAIEATGDLSRRVSGGDETDEVALLAKAFDRMLVMVEAAFRSQRRFLADASHELRSPLTVVRGQLEVLANELDDGVRGSLSTATGELDRMARIVHDLLLLSRLDEGMQLQRETVEVELVLREALLRAMLLAQRDVRVQAEPGIYALADADRLLQVVTNLVANAINHTDATGTIALSSRRENGRVLLHVSDNGSGIPREELPHVFERFYRGGKERASTPDGSGLGLAIARSLVAAMGGSIEVRSTQGVGTTFAVTLPAATAEPPLT